VPATPASPEEATRELGAAEVERITRQVRATFEAETSSQS
jgi:hypothetical protein